MKWNGPFKVFLFLFIIYAVYAGNKKFFQEAPSKLSNMIQPAEQSDADSTASVSESDFKLKFTPTEENSILQRWFSYGLNQVLDNPNGRAIFREIIQKTLTHQSDLSGHDLVVNRYATQDKIIGKGLQASCGDTVEILYSINVSKESPTKLKAVLVLGSSTIPDVIESGIVGMKEGGERFVTYPNLAQLRTIIIDKNSKDKTLEKITADVILNSVTKAPDLENFLGRPFFGRERKQLIDMPLICGDKVTGFYSVSKLDGTAIYDAKAQNNKISFKIGGESDKMPRALSDAIMGMHVNKAEVSFITTLGNIKKAFHNQPNFLPETVLNMKLIEPVVLSFDLAKGLPPS